MRTGLHSMHANVIRRNEMNRESDERHSTRSRWMSGSDAVFAVRVMLLPQSAFDRRSYVGVDLTSR